MLIVDYDGDRQTAHQHARHDQNINKIYQDHQSTCDIFANSNQMTKSVMKRKFKAAIREREKLHDFLEARIKAAIDPDERKHLQDLFYNNIQQMDNYTKCI